MRHISDNKYEYNVRQVNMLSKKLTVYEQRLEKATGVWEKFRIRRKIKKINKQLKNFNDEIFVYESNKAEE